MLKPFCLTGLFARLSSIVCEYVCTVHFQLVGTVKGYFVAPFLALPWRQATPDKTALDVIE